jgi:hypothetical protein
MGCRVSVPMKSSDLEKDMRTGLRVFFDKKEHMTSNP